MFHIAGGVFLGLLLWALLQVALMGMVAVSEYLRHRRWRRLMEAHYNSISSEDHLKAWSEERNSKWLKEITELGMLERTPTRPGHS